MSFVCLWSPAWRTVAAAQGTNTSPDANPAPVANPEIASTLLARAPRVATGAGGVIWADAHGFSTHGKVELAAELLTLLARRGLSDARAGIAATPVAAELAARHGGPRNAAANKVGPQAAGLNIVDRIFVVPIGADRTYVGLFPLAALNPEPRLRPLLFGIGVSTCGEFAALDRESIEVRLGAQAVPLWKLARADDPRLIFAPAPPEAPHASLEWVEYALKDPMRLLFVLNNLIERVCATLSATGEGAREITIEFALTSQSVHVEMIRASRPTANRRTWIRLVRTRVENIRLTAAVTGITVHASRIAPREAPQGDLFDKGLASSQATEDAVARLVEDQGEVVVTPQNSAHPLLDERTTWGARKPTEAVATTYAAELTRQTVRLTTLPAAVYERLQPQPRLHLQLAPAPRAIVVETTPRRDHSIPLRYRDDAGWHEVVNVAGPERVSGRTWDSDAAYAREYFRCVTKEGVLVWLFRDANENRKPMRVREGPPASGRWFLHGWWD